MTRTKSWKRKQRQNRMVAEREELERSGLLSAGKEAPFFRMLGIGEEKPAPGKDKNGVANKQWWAPAYLVRLNRYMKKYGVSSKLRARGMRCYVEGKDPPESILDALAGYTEEQLQRR